MTSDSRFARRVVRLAATSVVALGVIAVEAATTKAVSAPIVIALAVGWILMPAILVLSVRRPTVRYGVVIPAALVSVGLLAICVGGLPPTPIARIGWLMVSAGVWLGGVLGIWFWLRWVPVPARLDDPYAPGRWALIAVHVALIVAGLALLLISDVA